jgi:NTP pyrophosphatase (non-canonical NTP hydrolase)
MASRKHDTPMTIDELRRQLLAFRDARDWRQFHTVRNLVMSASIEAGELLETVQWESDEEIAALVADPAQRKHLEHECADVLMYLLLTADAAGFDLVEAAAEKLQLNEARYPVEKAKGKSTKYSDL